MTIKLFTIGDSISQGYMSGAVARTDLAFPTLIAKKLAITPYHYPEWGAGGLPAPFNIEPVLRRLVQRYGTDIQGLEWATVLQTINGVLQEAEEYYERGGGNPETPYETSKGDKPEFFHNIAIEGYDVADAYSITPQLCKQEIGLGPNSTVRNDRFLGPNAPFYRTALRVLNPQNDPQYNDFHAISWLEHLAKNEGIENLTLWLGGNNALGAVTSLEIRMTPNQPQKRPHTCSHIERKFRGWNLWHPEDFAAEYEVLLDHVERIMQKNKFEDWKIFIATIPHTTVAALAKGVGPVYKQSMDWGSVDDNGIYVEDNRIRTYFKYYTYFPFEEDYPQSGGKHLPLEHAVFIDRCILAYNRFIKNQIWSRNKSLGTTRYFCVDIANALDQIAYKRNDGNVTYKYPGHFEFIFPPVNTKFYHADESGNLKQGGLVSLDGVHPSAIGQGLIAYEFLKVMHKKANVVSDANLDWRSIFASDELYQKPIPLMHELYEHEHLLKFIIKLSEQLCSKNN